jgi:organic hydroperoxide reductase OsmC/OhrA
MRSTLARLVRDAGINSAQTDIVSRLKIECQLSDDQYEVHRLSVEELLPSVITEVKHELTEAAKGVCPIVRKWVTYLRYHLVLSQWD